ncbi:MAG: sialate O-acetylesterase [Eubacteriales bacterium]|nr:sialate O-acetylesterase [Eubacteriales bacterium]
MQLARVFQDGMVLQQKKPIRFWGIADRKENIRITWNNTALWDGVVEAGKVEIIVPALDACENGTFEFSCGIRLEHIDIGEVWIAGGQSNMEFPLGCERNYISGMDSGHLVQDEHLRFYDVGEFAFKGEREEGLKPAAVHWDRWMNFDSNHAEYFSAVGAYYGQMLRKSLGVPVGIIGCNWGGTTASAWMDKSILQSDKELSVYITDYECKIAGMDLEKYEKHDLKMRTKMSSSKAMGAGNIMFLKESTKKPSFFLRKIAVLSERFMPMGPHSERRPGGLYETMVSEIAGYSCKGVIWYQGEADEHHADLYGKLFEKLIHNWRVQWQDEIPFVFVQLAPFEEWMACSGKNYPEIRKQQQIVEDTVSGTYMVSIMDAGSRYDIHPKNKKIVGERMAFMALKEIYKKINAEAHAPRIKYQERKGNEILLNFEYTGKGLVGRGDISSVISVVQEKEELDFSAYIKGDSIIINCPQLKEKDAWVSFGHKDYLEMPLFNSDGIAARPRGPEKL